MLRLTKKRLGRVDIFIFASIFIATLLRFVLIYLHWPITNSDEGSMGLLARHIAYNGEWPIFYYGQAYMGPIEGYIATPLFHLFGSSTFILRLGLLPFFFLFLICMYYLTRLLFTHKLAIFTVVLLCFGSDEIIARQVKAVGEYPELVFFAAFISLIVIWLALSSNIEQQARTTPRRIFIYGILGLVAGIAVWVDFLVLPFLGTAIVLLWLFCRRELLSWAGLCMLAGIVIGIFPLLYYNITSPLNQGTIAALVGVSHTSSVKPLPFIQHIIGTLMIGIPNVTGLNPRCSATNFPYFGTASLHCVILQGGWGLGYLVLWAVATFIVVGIIWRGWRGRSLRHQEWTFEERQNMIRQCGQLMLLISVGGTILAYTLSSASAAFPEPTARYLECVLVAAPATLWPLWNGLNIQRITENWRTTISSIIRGCLLLLVLTLFVVGTFRTFTETSDAQKFYQQQDHVIQKLLDLGATRIYSEYWTCNRLMFQSNEKIICSVLNGNLRAGQDRYPLYHTIVRADTHPAYVFPLGVSQVTTIATKWKKDAQFHNTYQQLTFDGYVIYIPKNA
ncbi:MAG: hypothetical protein H0V70_19365 [Ktedonobacteraceae bacterium]|nr:hypothetical protein [Ktedonobacteraceae bacterium]